MVWTRSRTAKTGGGVDRQTKLMMELMEKSSAKERAWYRGNQKSRKQLQEANERERERPRDL